MRIGAALAGLVGGLAWIVAFVLDKTDHAGLGDSVAGLGLVPLTVATLAAGAGLVSRSATWLRVIVAVCLALLVWSVLQVLSDGVDERLVQAAAGLAVVAIAGAVLSRRPRPVQEPVVQSPGHRARRSHVR
ncbi:hypothetical protein GCM10023350_26290 [Nocardioides endophyticus]|uniref:SPW repeat-containing protein n=1 Tax=Nocardioides endophyticus TaxID=1353775 RepID=A0ABP8Z0A5_9ACTN